MCSLAIPQRVKTTRLMTATNGTTPIALARRTAAVDQMRGSREIGNAPPRTRGGGFLRFDMASTSKLCGKGGADREKSATHSEPRADGFRSTVRRSVFRGL